VGTWAPSLVSKPVVEGVSGKFDERVGEAPGPGPLVAGRGGGEGGKGDPQGGPADGVEHAPERDPAVLTAAELEAPGVDRTDLLGEHPGGIGGVASVGAVKTKTAHRVLEGQGEQRSFVEAGLAAEIRERPGGAGQQAQVGEPDPPGLEGGHARRQAHSLLPSGDRPGGGVAGHGALVADPVDR
jgi:hypothetical protein